jgi:hypothetical protein
MGVESKVWTIPSIHHAPAVFVGKESKELSPKDISTDSFCTFALVQEEKCGLLFSFWSVEDELRMT